MQSSLKSATSVAPQAIYVPFFSAGLNCRFSAVPTAVKDERLEEAATARAVRVAAQTPGAADDELASGAGPFFRELARWVWLVLHSTPATFGMADGTLASLESLPAQDPAAPAQLLTARPLPSQAGLALAAALPCQPLHRRPKPGDYRLRGAAGDA